MTGEGLDIGHDQRPALGRRRPADPLPEADTQAAESALIGPHHQLTRPVRIHDVEAGPEEPLEALGQHGGHGGHPGGEVRLALENRGDFFGQVRIAGGLGCGQRRGLEGLSHQQTRLVVRGRDEGISMALAASKGRAASSLRPGARQAVGALPSAAGIT